MSTLFQPTIRFSRMNHFFLIWCSTITPPFENSCSTIELSNTLMERGFVFDNSFDNSEFSNDTLPFEGFLIWGYVLLSVTFREGS